MIELVSLGQGISGFKLNRFRLTVCRSFCRPLIGVHLQAHLLEWESRLAAGQATHHSFVANSQRHMFGLEHLSRYKADNNMLLPLIINIKAIIALNSSTSYTVIMSVRKASWRRPAVREIRNTTSPMSEHFNLPLGCK